MMITNRYVVEIASLSRNHVGEELCGDNVQILSPDEKTSILVLADGLGSGVKANILSTLTSEMLATMMSNNVPIEECVQTIAMTLPVCKVRGVAYSTFSIVKVSDFKNVEIYNYDNPTPIILRDGKIFPIWWETSLIEGKKIEKAKFEFRPYDTIVLMSDGVMHAGIGETLNFGWGMDEVKSFVSTLYDKSYSSKALATMLVDHCDELYARKPGDDTTAAVLRLRERKQVSLLIGPASNREDDNMMLSLFFAKDGVHIVSGGTTSSIVSRYLNKPLDYALDYLDKDIPPIAKIEGVDLVTEGVVTINRVLEYAKDVLDKNEKYFYWSFHEDGASRIARYLFEDATDIDFYVGCAINPAHQSEDMHINIKIKMRLIEELAKCLEKMGKKIKVSYF